MPLIPTVPLLLALLAAPLALLAGMWRPQLSAPVGASLAAATFAALFWGWWNGGGSLDLAWAPAWGLRLHFSLDGLAALYALLASGIGCLVLIYSASYLPAHLEHDGRSQKEAPRFFFFLLLFMGAMVGLVTAQDLLLVFLFWDITAIASYYLIGYDHETADARASALMALLITGISSVLFLIGAFILAEAYGSYSIPVLLEQATAGPMLTIATLLIAVAALAKSAQAPLHFWLPRAMAAPTPVSAYLHSAAMVAAGVFLLGRFYPLIALSPLVQNLLLVIGILSMALGGFLALSRGVMKQILAYSTIAQYGYVVFMLGIGGEAALKAAAFYVLAHALCKSGLFLTAGAVTEATHKKELAELGGLRGEMPWLAFGSGVLAAGLAALPLTIGFFKDELFFKAAYEHGPWYVVAALLGTVLTLVYIWRFWSGIFLGKKGAEVEHRSLLLTLPVVMLAVPVLIGGLWPNLFTPLAGAAAGTMYGEPLELHVAYHFAATPENLLALSTYVLGALLIVGQRIWAGPAAALAMPILRYGPEQWYQASLAWLNRLSQRANAFDIRDLRWRIATILVAMALLLDLSILLVPPEQTWQFALPSVSELPIVLSLGLSLFATLLVLPVRNMFTLVLALSTVGYGLAAVYAFLGSPDVALVAVLVETVLTLLLLGALVLFPSELFSVSAPLPDRPSLRWRNPLIALAGGLGMFGLSWSLLGSEPAGESVADRYLELAEAAHAGDVVTAILADFRGLDTMGEISVIVLALLAVASLLQWRRSEL